MLPVKSYQRSLCALQIAELYEGLELVVFCKAYNFLYRTIRRKQLVQQIHIHRIYHIFNGDQQNPIWLSLKETSL